MAGFPNSFVSLAINGNGHVPNLNLDPDADYLARNAILYGNLNYPGRLIVQKNGFSTTTTLAPGGDGNFELLYDAYPNGGGQMLFWCFNDPTYRMNGGIPGDPATMLHTTVNIGLGYRVKFLEIYQLDCVNLPRKLLTRTTRSTMRRRRLQLHLRLRQRCRPDYASSINPTTWRRPDWHRSGWL